MALQRVQEEIAAAALEETARDAVADATEAAYQRGAQDNARINTSNAVAPVVTDVEQVHDYIDAATDVEKMNIFMYISGAGKCPLGTLKLLIKKKILKLK